MGNRKQHTIDMLKDASLEEIQVIVADKYHNLKSIQNDLHIHGDAIWQRFNVVNVINTGTTQVL